MWIELGAFEAGPMRRNRHRPIMRAVPLGSIALFLLVGCTRAPSSPSLPALDVTLRDFRISASASQVGTGPLLFRVINQGPATHEFVVVRSDLPADGLPIGPDGLSVDEDRLHGVGEISEVDSGTSETLALTLPAGRYIFFCNLEGHYLGGMHGAVEVGDA